MERAFAVAGLAAIVAIAMRRRGAPHTGKPATVYLVGAGPGAADLVTVRGLALIDACTALLTDRLVSPALVARAEARGARIVPVGKSASKDRLKQETIDELLVRLAFELGAPCTIVRLKGGDPFVFGLGGNEVLALQAAGVPCEVVPGLSSSMALPLLAGVPLTHKDVAAGFTVLSGHDGANGSEWRELPATPSPSTTLVVLMISKNLAAIADHLTHARGWDPALPARLVQNGATPAQRVLASTLGAVAQAAADAGMTEAPLVLIAGRACAVLPAPSAAGHAVHEWGQLMSY